MKLSFSNRLFTFIAVVFVAASCSVPTEDTAQAISQDELPETLQNVAPPTTTTTIARANEPFTYFVLQQRAELETRFVVAVSRAVEIGANPATKLAPMFSDDFVTPEEDDAGLLNQMPGFGLDAIDVNGGIATVRLNIESETGVGQDLLSDIAAQLVWTLIGVDNIEEILIEINGDLTPLPTDEGDVSVPVTKDQYPTYERDFEPADIDESADDS